MLAKGAIYIPGQCIPHAALALFLCLSSLLIAVQKVGILHATSLLHTHNVDFSRE